MAMSYEHKFCDNYLLLKPEKASFFDLLSFLYSSESETSGFIECPQEVKYRDFQSRWYISISLFVQKLLLILKKPLALIGCMVELWLNLHSSNGGFLKLWSNFLKGKVVWPDRASATFTSVVGNLDQRVELDRSIKPGNKKYNASLSMMAAKLSYESKAFVQTIIKCHWNMEFLGFYNFKNDFQIDGSTQAIMFQDTKVGPNLIVIAFRGTHPFNADALRTDVDISFCELKGVGKVHSGFMKALGFQKSQGWPKEIERESDFAYYGIRKMLRDMLQKNEKAKFILTGHSLGGALAILFVTVLMKHEEAWLLEKLEGVYTFGQPRVGDKQLEDFMMCHLSKYNVKYLRYVYCNDMVPRIPYDNETSLFKHFGRCLYYNKCYKGKDVLEEPNKNYFSLLWVIPKCLNAVWELIRGFIIPFTSGSDYKEGWLMRMFRVFGLVLPGLVAHFPQDYVNTTRLGSLHLESRPPKPKSS